jgi:hypothetical protein
MKSFALAITVFVLAACASGPPAPPLKTATGRPEIVINAPVEKVRATIISSEVGAGSKMVSETQSSLTFSIPITSFAAGLLYGSGLSPTPYGRATFTMVSAGEKTRVFVSAEMVSNYGTAFERVYPSQDPQTYQNLQRSLERIKLAAEK